MRSIVCATQMRLAHCVVKNVKVVTEKTEYNSFYQTTLKLHLAESLQCKCKLVYMWKKVFVFLKIIKVFIAFQYSMSRSIKERWGKSRGLGRSRRKSYLPLLQTELLGLRLFLKRTQWIIRKNRNITSENLRCTN